VRQEYAEGKVAGEQGCFVPFDKEARVCFLLQSKINIKSALITLFSKGKVKAKAQGLG
jgi:hypothetical protein